MKTGTNLCSSGLNRERSCPKMSGIGGPRNEFQGPPSPKRLKVSVLRLPERDRRRAAPPIAAPVVVGIDLAAIAAEVRHAVGVDD